MPLYLKQFFVLLALLTSCTSEKEISSTCHDFPWPDIRLPQWIEPEHYVLQIHPNLTTETFNGSVDVELNVKLSTDLIILHSNQLTILDVQIVDVNGRILLPKKIKVCQDDRQQIAIRVEQKLHPNFTYTLSMNFSGDFSLDMLGLYKMDYITNGTPGFLATTQLAPVAARKVFPCWDEPSFKAYFTLKVVRDLDMLVLSNSELVSTTHLTDGLAEDTFEKSLKMSTYLLAFVVSNYVQISDRTSNGVKVSVYAPQSQIEQGRLALNSAMKSLAYFETLFKIEFPLKKVDQIAVSMTLWGMEHWGLITYNDKVILSDPDGACTSCVQSILELVAHEFAHQWFGNLVTMKWWNDIYLNEAFAEFFGEFVASELNPDWNMMGNFVARTTTPAMYADAMVNSRPLSASVKEPRAIQSMFDTITYQKGAAVVRMVIELFGREKIFDGMVEFLSTFKYSSVDGTDFWNVIHKHAPEFEGISILNITKDYIHQPGYPMVHVEIKNGKLLANQTRFLLSQEQMKKATGKHLWHIPLTVITDNGKKFMHWMKREKEISVDIKEPHVKWFKVNVDSIGYYRVNYNRENWRALINQLKENHQAFSTSDRCGLLSDIFAFFQMGMFPADTLLDLLPYLEKETSYGPWAIASQQITQMEFTLRDSDTYLPYKRFVRKFLTPMYKKYGWDLPLNHESKLVQKDVLALSCQFDVEDCKAKATKQLDAGAILHNQTNFWADYRGLACSSAIETDPESAWDNVFGLYSKLNLPSEKIDFLVCMGYANDAARLQSLLETSLNSSTVSTNDINMVGSMVSSNINGTNLFWRFFQRKYNELEERLAPALMKGLVAQLAHFNSKTDYEDVKTFFQDKEFDFKDIYLEKVLESIQANIQFLEMNENRIASYLRANGYYN